MEKKKKKSENWRGRFGFLPRFYSFRASRLVIPTLTRLPSHGRIQQLHHNERPKSPYFWAECKTHNISIIIYIVENKKDNIFNNFLVHVTTQRVQGGLVSNKEDRTTSNN